MASSSGTSSGGSSSAALLQNSGSEGGGGGGEHVMDQRKRKRMLSNRESARRSRMRKQKHLDDLMAQVSQLRKENNQILTSLNITSQHYLNFESENSILRAQMAELNNRLQSLNEITHYLTTANNNHDHEHDHDHDHDLDHYYSHGQLMNATTTDSFMNPWNMAYMNQPIMASADMFQY